MIIRKVDSNNDWTFGKGKNNYIKDKSAVSQNIKTRLQSFLGDCFFALNQGLDWFNLLGSKDDGELRLAISTTILNTENVVSLSELSLNLDSERKLTINYEVNTTFGLLENQTVTTEL